MFYFNFHSKLDAALISVGIQSSRCINTLLAATASKAAYFASCGPLSHSVRYTRYPVPCLPCRIQQNDNTAEDAALASSAPVLDVLLRLSNLLTHLCPCCLAGQQEQCLGRPLDLRIATLGCGCSGPNIVQMGIALGLRNQIRPAVGGKHQPFHPQSYPKAAPLAVHVSYQTCFKFALVSRWNIGFCMPRLATLLLG